MVKATSTSTDTQASFLSEDSLAHAADLLHCAIETAHSSAESMNVQQRAVMHLVEMAKVVVDQALDCTQSR